MAIKIKAVERLISIGKYAGTYRYVMSAERYNTLSNSKVIAEASIRSGLQKATLQTAWEAIGDVIQAWATEGHSVAIPGLGSMRFSLKAASVSNVEKVSSDLITARKVIFTPSKAIKNELNDTSVSISCYDRNGKLVKTVTSTNDESGDFEVELISSPENGGTFEGAGFYNENDVAVIKAIPADGYEFVKWDDDVTDPERTIAVSDDVTFVATFKSTAASSGNINSGDNTGGTTVTKRTLTLSASPSNGGTVSGAGQYNNGASANINAVANSGYTFTRWSDGNTSASRTIVMDANKTLTATFTADAGGGENPGGGTEGDDNEPLT